jgi:hypothetical protein
MNFKIFIGLTLICGVFNTTTANISLEDQDAGIDNPNRRWWSHKTHLKHPERQMAEVALAPMDPTLEPFVPKLHQKVQEHNLETRQNHTISFQPPQQWPQRYRFLVPIPEQVGMMNQNVRGHRRHQYRRMRPSKVPTAEHTTEGIAQPYGAEPMPRQVMEFGDNTRNPLKTRDFKRRHHIYQMMPKQTPTDPINADFELRAIG